MLAWILKMFVTCGNMFKQICGVHIHCTVASVIIRDLSDRFSRGLDSGAIEFIIYVAYGPQIEIWKYRK